MKMFVLQNKDFTELYWSSEYGWADLNNADRFFGSELDQEHCLELMTEKKGRWVTADFNYTIGDVDF